MCLAATGLAISSSALCVLPLMRHAERDITSPTISSLIYVIKLGGHPQTLLASFFLFAYIFGWSSMAPVILRQEPSVFARVRSYWLDDDDARHANPNLEIVFSSSSSGLFLLLLLFVFIYICAIVVGCQGGDGFG